MSLFHTCALARIWKLGAQDHNILWLHIQCCTCIYLLKWGKIALCNVMRIISRWKYFNYILEIDILRNDSEIFGCPEGWFLRFECRKDTQTPWWPRQMFHTQYFYYLWYSLLVSLSSLDFYIYFFKISLLYVLISLFCFSLGILFIFHFLPASYIVLTSVYFCIFFPLSHVCFCIL